MRRDPRLVSEVLRTFLRVLFAYQRRKARQLGLVPSAARAKTGAVTSRHRARCDQLACFTAAPALTYLKHFYFTSGGDARGRTRRP